ncbi:MAG: S41 family peptidase [Planctomycetota bacterium]
MHDRRRRLAAFAAATLLAGCSTLASEEAGRLRVFDTYWQALADGYPYFGHKHVDWNALRAQYRSAAVYARRPSEFYHLLTGMLARLADPHVSLTVPAANWRENDVAATSLDDIEGFTRIVLEGHIHVTSWPPGAAPQGPDHLPAEACTAPEIVRIEDVPVVWPLVENLFLGPPDSSVELALRWSDGTSSRHVLHRPSAPPPKVTVDGDQLILRIDKSMKLRRSPVAAAKLTKLDRFALLRVDTFSLDDLAQDDPGAFSRHLDTLVDDAMASDGLVLDLRNNGGGDYATTRAFAGRFLRSTYTQVLPEERSTYLFGLLSYNYFRHAEWDPRPPIFSKPVVVLTSWHTGSAAEHLARLLQTDCGAMVVGERTIGAEAAVQTVAGEDGSTLSFGRERLLDTKGRGLQDEGVVPDVPVLLRLQDVERLGSVRAARQDWEQRLLRAAIATLARRG